MKKILKGRSMGNFLFDNINKIIMVTFCLLICYPLWYILVISFNDGADALRGGIYFWPREFTLTNYTMVLEDSSILKGYGITIARTLIGTATSVLFTAATAYAFSKAELIGRKAFLTMGTITLIFNGGLIPTFMLLRGLNLLDNFLVYIIPTLFNFYNCIIFMSFFRSIPASLEEAAMVDGCNYLRRFGQIVLPLSKPVLATIALFNGVWHWNDYFSGVVYVNNPDLVPLQTILYRTVASASTAKWTAAPGVTDKMASSMGLKFATMVVVTLPIMLVYPFLQKYFVKGVMVGAVKG